MTDLKNMPDDYWKKRLTPEQYAILREQRTEPPFTGAYVDNHEDGTYTCAACGQQLFSSRTKYDSGSGWPSFYDVITAGNVELHEDHSHGMTRTEVVCANCGSHLGHLFDDGPTRLPDGQQATGQRYCINSAALQFTSEK